MAEECSLRLMIGATEAPAGAPPSGASHVAGCDQAPISAEVTLQLFDNTLLITLQEQCMDRSERRAGSFNGPRVKAAQR